MTGKKKIINTETAIEKMIELLVPIVQNNLPVIECLSIRNLEHFNKFIKMYNTDNIDITKVWKKKQLEYFYKDSYNKLHAPDFDYILESMVDNDKDIEEKDVTEQLEWIRNIPQHEQRTPEWFAFRETLISASSLYKIFTSEGTKRSLLKEKIITKPFKKGPPLIHGIRYEPIAQDAYMKITKSNVTEYGCIRHKQIEHIGASPDGIVTKAEDKKLVGRMLEIKCLYSRQLLGLPKYDYWVQMQMQLEVCDLEYCDFFECAIDEYKSYKELVRIMKENRTNEYICYGGIIEAVDVEKDITHTYHSNQYYEIDDKVFEEFEDWKDNKMQEAKETHPGLVITFIGWGLLDYSLVTIKRNREWFSTKTEEISKFWDNVVEHRELFKTNPNLFGNEIGRAHV